MGGADRCDWGSITLDTVGNRYVTDTPPANGRPNGGRLIKIGAGTAFFPTELPLSGLRHPTGVAVDDTDALYLADTDNNRVVKLFPDQRQLVVSALSGLNQPGDVAVDATGALYITDTGNNRVLRLPAGHDQAEVLPLGGLSRPGGVAVDARGTVYVTDTGNSRVVKLAADRSQPEVVECELHLDSPTGICIDVTGNASVVVTAANRILCLEPAIDLAGQFRDVKDPRGVVVHPDGDIYVVDSGNNQILKLSGRGAGLCRLPVSGLANPTGLAIDRAGNIYLSDTANGRILKLATD